MAIHTHMEVVSFFSLYFNFKIKEVDLIKELVVIFYYYLR